MAGEFDDLIPQQSAPQGGGLFDDLVPAAPMQARAAQQPWYKQAGQAADDIVRLAADGLTFGYADKLAGYMGGDGAEAERARTAAARERSGIPGMVAEYGAPIGVLSSAAKAGITASRLVPQGLAGYTGLGARTAAMAGEGAGLGALTAAGHDTDIATGAALGAGAGAVGNVAGEAIARGVSKAAGAFNKKPAVPTTEELKEASRAAYKASDDAGVIIKPDGLQRLAGEIKADLAEKGFLPKLQPKVAAALEELDRVANDNITLKGVDVLRRVASAAKTDADPSTRMLGGSVVSKIDDFLDNMNATDVLTGNKTEGVRALQEARKTWATVRKSEMIDEAIERATNNTAAAGSGGNINNALRQQFRSILNNPKRARGLTPDEREAMLTIVRGTPTQNALRLVGKLSPQGNGLMLTMQAVGGVASGGASIPLAIAGGAAKAVSDKATQKGVEQLSRVVRAGGDASATMPAPNVVERLTEAERETLARLLTLAGVEATGP